MNLYPLLRSLLFNINPESVHHLSMDAMHRLSGNTLTRRWLETQFGNRVPQLPVETMGLRFKNPVGLAAGFDKNAHYLLPLHLLGFGFVEIGTVTPRPQPGNETPRLFRLPQDRALLNRMGFNNNGVKAVAGRLRHWRERPESRGPQAMIIGANLGKNKDTDNDDAWRDYVTGFEELAPLADYFVVNVSSPNTPGLRSLQQRPALEKILGEVQERNQRQPQPKPLLLKIAPDLALEDVDELARLCVELQLSGMVATNTTISRKGLTTPAAEVEKLGAGGISGLPVRQRSTDIIARLSGAAPGLPLIASGGIFDGQDALDKIKAGASLVQVYTGFIYEGPAIVRRLVEALQTPLLQAELRREQ